MNIGLLQFRVQVRVGVFFVFFVSGFVLLGEGFGVVGLRKGSG